MSNNIETIIVNLSEIQQRAIRKMALQSGKLSNEEFAENLVNSAIKNRLTQMFMSDAAKEKLAKRWDNAASFIGADMMPQTRGEFISNQLADVKELLSEL
jgi:hypothetical protein